MLNLDGAKFDVETRELIYKLPEPFGPKKGEAILKIIAKPASAQNPKFKAALDKLLTTAKQKDLLRQKEYQRTDDVEVFIKSGEEDTRKTNLAIVSLQYDHCVEIWETDIQSDGKTLESTKENFIALSEFPHPVLAKIFMRFKDDLTDFTKWQGEVEKSLEEEELGNSKSS